MSAGLVTLRRPILIGKESGPEIDLPLAGAVVDELLAFARIRLAKARLPEAVRSREKTIAALVPTFREELVEYFGGLLSRTAIRKADAFPIDPDAIDWEVERSALRTVLEAAYAELGAAAYEQIAGQLGLELEFNLEARPLGPVRNRLATMVTGITERTRELIRAYVETSIERGYSVEQLVNGVDGDAFLGLEAIFAERAQTIALTETASAYNLASSAGWRESGLVETVLIFDGPECGWDGHDDSDQADGSIRTLDEFDETPTSHPNCQRAAGPVVAE